MYAVRMLVAFGAVGALARASLEHEDLRALEAADECTSDGNGCALHALQVRAGKLGEEVAVVTVPVDPALKSDVQGLPLKEMGTSELTELQAQLGTELEMRQDGEGDLGAAEDWESVPPSSSGGATGATAHCFARAYTGSMHGTERCFCELANNSACADGCHCPQGCQGITWEHEQSVSFKNRARAHGWPSTVILTSPRGYYRDMNDLKAQKECTVPVINQLLLDSWHTFQKDVHRTSVWQCFHGSKIASVKYLHLQTFTSHGSFHGMPTRNHHVAMCVKMHSEGESMKLAQELANQIPQ